MRVKKTVLCVYWYPFFSSPALVNLSLDLIAGNNFQACIDHRFCRQLDKRLVSYIVKSCAKADISSRQKLTTKNQEVFLGVLKKIRLPKLLKALLVNIRVFIHYFSSLREYISLLRWQDVGSVFISADKFALLPCLLAGRVPQIYYSLEASPFWDEPTLLNKALNVVEKLYIKKYNPFVISQSKTRAAIVQPQVERQIIIPVTSWRAPTRQNDFIRERYGIHPANIIVTLAGGLGADQLTETIVKHAIEWEEKFVLFLHSISGRYSDCIKLQAELNPGRIVLSESEYSIEEAEDKIYAGSNIGIIAYKDLGFNYRNTARSSGKLASFLRAGVPLILPPFDDYALVLSDYQFGLQYQQASQIGDILDHLVTKYSALSGEALRAYSELYWHKNYEGMIARCISEL